jgi:hypothetical protein
LSIDKDYLKKLNEEDKSVLIVEKDGSSKNFEVDDRDLMDIWLNNKSAKKPRQVLIEKTKEYHALKNYANGGMFEDNDGFMKADNNFNYRYPQGDVHVDTIDEPIDLTNSMSSRTNEVVIQTLDENIDLNEDGRIRARLTYEPKNRTPEKMMMVNQRMVIENFPKPTSNKHKND